MKQKIPWMDLFSAWAEQANFTITVKTTPATARRTLGAHFGPWLRNQTLQMGHPRPFWEISEVRTGKWECVVRFGRKRTIVAVAQAPDPVLSLIAGYHQARAYFPA